MKLLQLKIFRDIAYEKSFVKAAEINCITQPAISAHLKLLEEELGVRLFDRVPRNVALTLEGRTYLSHVEEILQKCNNLKNLPGLLKQSPQGEIRVASIPSIGMYELGSFLRSFMYQYPQIKIDLQYQDAQKVYDLIKSKKVDLGMVAYPEKISYLSHTLFGKDSLALIVPAHHPLAQEKKINLKDINNEPFIAFDSNTPTRNQIDTFLKNRKVEVSIKITNNNIYALKKAVEAGLGISIVPWKTVDDEVRAGTILRFALDGNELYRPLAITTLKGRVQSNLNQLFINSLVAHHCRD